MKKIDSTTNELIKKIVLLKKSVNIKKNSQYLIEGEKMIDLAVYLKKAELILISDKKYLDKYKNFKELILINDNIAKKITSLINHQGVFAVCGIENSNLESNFDCLVLDDVQNPGNMGTILRSASAFGFKNIISSDNSVSFYNEKVLRATQSNHFQLNLISSNDIEKDIINLKNKGYFIVGSYLKNNNNNNNEKNNNKNDSHKKYALVLGNEGSGIKDNLVKYFDKNIIIKMEKDVESLNVAVAGSIIMKELYYQKNDLR
ncbi:RNA methyltransferase, TrmH family [Spiroplasma litorale]|uniref:RNA methyltransferase, TrmH family n=1 Tax=Spiroplasma litorale TaxID=216942 RepID=A0A0K1W1C3_9MOLU|nr:RNA methyltransferase [Spiroplasma litorale]AKX33892.1 RNA methyltransferase, TrmH family [Spiroplasma litorale]